MCISRTENVRQTRQSQHAAVLNRRCRLVRSRTLWAFLGLIALLLTVSVVPAGCMSRGLRSTAPSSPAPARPPAISATPPGAVLPPQSGPNNLAIALAADFRQLQGKLHAVMGIAMTAVGADQNPVMLGDWQSGPAWSTMKVPLTIAALRAEDRPEVSDAITVAITESDNAAAESIWEKLGDPAIAAHKVEAVLQEAGDPTIVQSQKVRAEFTAFGQTDWSLINQVRFTSIAACDRRDAPIFALMGQVEQGQRWGLGVIANTRFKGGWGPSISGRYLVRQIGVLATPTGMSAVAMATESASGSFNDGTRDLTEMAEWLSEHVAALPTGHCVA